MGESLPCPRCDEDLAELWDEQADVAGAAALSAPFPFRGAARDLIHRMKYEGNRPAAELLGSLMGARLSVDVGDRPTMLLIPVPLHRTRLRERGFNQAERLADAAARETLLQTDAKILVRVRAGVSQTTLDPEERRTSVAGAFRARRPPADRALILVDDVWTTGATTEACRQALRDAGARGTIRVLVAARTPLRCSRMGTADDYRREAGRTGPEPID